MKTAEKLKIAEFLTHGNLIDKQPKYTFEAIGRPLLSNRFGLSNKWDLLAIGKVKR